MTFVTNFIKGCWGERRLFITREGYIGLCPPYVKQGDLMYVVPGVSTPIMLRQQKNIIAPTGSAKEYQLVGECYAHGLMNGEGLGMELELEELVIK